MNFASSSVGGLKIVEEKTAPPRAGRSDGMRQRQVSVLLAQDYFLE
jgi:hypothetical protein